MKLYEKMIRQIEDNNTQAVKKLIRKGAYIDREFYKLPNGSYFTRYPILENFLTRYYTNTTVHTYTPLARAAEKGNQSLAQFILKAKNCDVSSDKKQTAHYFLIKTTGPLYSQWRAETMRKDP